MDQENVGGCICIDLYTHEYYLSSQKEILPFMTTWMKMEVLMLSEINQTDKYGIVSHTGEL